MEHLKTQKLELNSLAIPTERPPLVGEVNVNFYG
jgi:hypothetical protein